MTAPKLLVVALSPEPADARDLYGEHDLTCAGCGCTNQRACPGGCSWVLPGLCSQCALRVSLVMPACVKEVTLAKPQQQTMFETGRMPG